MADLITWQKSLVLSNVHYGYTEEQDPEEDVALYRIKDNSLAVGQSKVYRSIDYIRFATLEDAKQCAELIERGRCAD